MRDPNAGVSYPGHALIGHRTALCLFCRRLPWPQRRVLARRRRPVTTCVDTDEQRLDEMRAIYPNDWGWEVADAFAFADMAAVLGRQWDVVASTRSPT